MNCWMRMAAVMAIAVSGVLSAPAGHMLKVGQLLTAGPAMMAVPALMAGLALPGGLALVGANVASEAVAQQTQPRDLLAEPEIEKVSRADRAGFQRRFGNVQWTGAGFEGSTVIDRIPTRELRARLQKVYGDPSQKLRDLIDGSNFRPGHYIQFEYWFVINDEIPMMVLDIDGPFGNGLVFAGDSRYVDLMPEIKRTLSSKLMGITELAEYEDHYFDINEQQWYLVRYHDGSFSNEKVPRPRSLR